MPDPKQAFAGRVQPALEAWSDEQFEFEAVGTQTTHVNESMAQ
jgi:hypothetical protein